MKVRLMAQGKHPHKNMRFQLRIDQRLLNLLKKKAGELNLPVNQFVAMIIERNCDDMAIYYQQMAAKHSYMSYAVMNVLAAKVLPPEIRKEVMMAIGEQAHRLFGANPEVPDEVAVNINPTQSEYVWDMFLLFERYATSRWGIRPGDS